jgi:hypothetical protein
MDTVLNSTTTFSNLNIEVTDATSPAFFANDSSEIIVNGNSSVINNSNATGSYTIQTTGTNVLGGTDNSMEFKRVGSGKPQADPVVDPDNIAVEFSGPAPSTIGTFTITDEFTIGGAQGTAANVSPGGVTVTVPTP